MGCTGTVLEAMYGFYGIEIPKNIAGALLCAILSDTVMFKSPTCTDADKKAVESLAKIAGVADYMALGMEMFKVKSAVDGADPKDLVFRDYKDFDMSRQQGRHRASWKSSTCPCWTTTRPPCRPRSRRSRPTAATPYS